MPGTLPNATATLVLGIISVVICGVGLITGIIAIVLHKSDKALYESNPQMYEQSYKNARAGFICGVIGICLSAFFILFYAVWMIFVFSMVSHFPHH